MGVRVSELSHPWVSPGSRCEGGKRWKQRGFRTLGSVPGAPLSSVLWDSAPDPCPALQLPPKARQVTALVLRRLLPSRPLPCFPPGQRNSLSSSSEAQHPTCSHSLHGPLQIPRAQERLASWALLQCSAHPLPPSEAPINRSLCPLQPPRRTFPTCLGRVSLRPVEEQTEAGSSQ